MLLPCFFLISVLTGCSSSVKSSNSKALDVIATNSVDSTTYKVAPEHSQQELNQDVFVTLLAPYIQKQLDDYYGQSLTTTPMYSPEYVKILNIERPMGYRSFLFIIKLQIEPYIGSHINLGVDQLTIQVEGKGTVTIKEYNHVKSYEN